MEIPIDGSSNNSTASSLTGGSISYATKNSSGVLDNYASQENNKYEPVTNFEPQERVNPFDKDTIKNSGTSTTIGGASIASTSSSSPSSSASASSISSRINRSGSVLKSQPPPLGPPPPPPPLSGAAAAAPNRSSSISGKDNTSRQSSYGNFGSSTSIETITRMDTTTATTTGISGVTATTNLNAESESSAETEVSNAPNALTDWRSSIGGIRSASVYSAPAIVAGSATGPVASAANTTAAASNDTVNNPADLPSYTRPSYSRSESNDSRKSDLDIIFGEESKPFSYGGNGKYTRSGGSISDADYIFGGGPSHYKSDRYGASKSMSVTTSDRPSTNIASTYKIYEGIQNAAFSDYSDSPTKHTVSTSSIVTSFSSGGGEMPAATSTSSNTQSSVAISWSKPPTPPPEEEDDLDLK